jgi:hypothetical protein
MRLYHTTVVAALLGMSSSFCLAQDTKIVKEEIRSSLSKDSEKTACFGACTINFQKELGANFGFLIPLGSQIHQARLNADPVTIAVAAISLSAAETATGKQAKVTAKQVMAEAVELAKIRGDVKELKAIAQLVSNAATKSQLKQLIESAEDSAAEVDEASREHYGTLTVENHTPHDLRIMVDGRVVGHVHAGRTRSLRVHAHAHTNHYAAYCMDDGDLIKRAHASGHNHHLNWHIDE